jgi:hypothetical protein
MREVRQDFMVKLYFLMNSVDETDRGLAHQLIEEQIEVCEAYAEEVNAELLAVEPGSFDALALGSKLSAARLTRTWLVECINVLEGS